MKQKNTVPAPSNWQKKDPGEFPGNPFERIGKEWMLITSGRGESPSREENWNTMTASWGGLGVLWNKPSAFIFIRPGRHTYGFIESNQLFSLSFFEEKYRDALTLCGSKSGRDINKAKESNLSPILFPDSGIGFNEAKDVLVCKKVYYQDLDSRHFLEPSIAGNYPKKDYHRMFVGEIISYWSR